jgi:hypothetical protein
MKSKIVFQEKNDTSIIHVTCTEVNHTDLHDYPDLAAKLKKILKITLGNALDYPYMEVRNFCNLPEIISQLDNLNFKYAVFWHDGTWPNGHEFESQLKKCIEENNHDEWLAAGHILAFPGKLPKWHQQCVIVNISKFQECNIEFIDKFTEDYPDYLMSREHHHDDYTPTWITGTGLDKYDGDLVKVPITDNEYEPDNIFDTLFPHAIKNNLPVLNLPQDLRDEKECCYPEDDTELTAKWFLDQDFPKALSADELLEFRDKYIHEDKQSLAQFKIMDTEIVYITNKEGVPEKRDFGATAISVPCSGLHQFKYASNNISTLEKIVWCDFSPLGIRWTKKLLADWDGRNFHQFFQDNQDCLRDKKLSWYPDHITMIYDPDLVDKFVRSFGTEDQWIAMWNKIKNLEHVFVQADIIADWQKLVDAIGENDILFLQLSNILQYEINYINNDIVDVELAFGNLIKNLMINNGTVYFTGDTPDNRHYNGIDLKILTEIV